MFVKVDSPTLKEKFKETVLESWKEYNHEFEAHGGEQYVILNEENNISGTVELTDYSIENCYVDTWFPFYEQKHVIVNQNNIVQISNLSVLPKQRGKNVLEKILATITCVGKRKDTKYFIAIINPLLYKILKLQFHLPVIALSETIKGKTVPGLPIIFNFEEFLKDGKFKGFIERLDGIADNQIKDFQFEITMTKQ